MNSNCIECGKSTKYFVSLPGWAGLVPLCTKHLPKEPNPVQEKQE